MLRAGRQGGSKINAVTLQTSCTLSFTVAVPTPMLLMLRPRNDSGQSILNEAYHMAPPAPVTQIVDGFGNGVQRLIAPVGDFSVASSAEVVVQIPKPSAEIQAFVPVAELPGEVLQYLLPSRYCESDRFGDMALDIVAGLSLGGAQVDAICAWVNDNIRNIPGSSTFPVSATEINSRREGVCRDLAHMVIALCRALCIPARLTVGYLYGLQPMDIHAWCQVFIGGRWHTYDPASPAAEHRRVIIALGRDAADVAIYNQFGPLLLPNEMTVAVECSAESS